MAGLALLALAGCRDDAETDVPAAGAPVAPITQPTPALTGPPDLRCLIAGSPWKVSKGDLESQFKGVMRGVDITGVHITGDQTLTVSGDLRATFVDKTTTKITANMGQGLTMVMTQKHDGSSAGRWKAEGNKLTPDGAWEGGINTSTRVAINGRSGGSPANVPNKALGGVPLSYTCVDGVLNISAQGSPFVYLFR